jgi:hypothetical protein
MKTKIARYEHLFLRYLKSTPAKATGIGFKILISHDVSEDMLNQQYANHGWVHSANL